LSNLAPPSVFHSSSWFDVLKKKKKGIFDVEIKGLLQFDAT